MFLFLSILEYEDACSQKVQDKSISYFQIKDASGNVLEDVYKKNIELQKILFSPNEYKDSQFWYWHQQPNSDYGYIGNKQYYHTKKVLSIAFSPYFETNGKFEKVIANTHFRIQSYHFIQILDELLKGSIIRL